MLCRACAMKILLILKLSIQSHLRYFISIGPSFIAFENTRRQTFSVETYRWREQESKSRTLLNFNECNFENWNCLLLKFNVTERNILAINSCPKEHSRTPPRTSFYCPLFNEMKFTFNFTSSR